MKENLKDILSHLNPGVSPETLLLYLQGKLTPQQQHELEKSMLQDDFDTEAFEGLTQVENKQKVTEVVDQLNTELRRKTVSKKRKKRNEFKEDPWLWIALLIILFLVVISYIIIHKQLTES